MIKLILFSVALLGGVFGSLSDHESLFKDFIIKYNKQYLDNNDILSLVGSIFIIAAILPIIPSGSFFTTYTATIFWINVSLILRYKK